MVEGKLMMNGKTCEAYVQNLHFIEWKCDKPHIWFCVGEDIYVECFLVVGLNDKVNVHLELQRC